VNRSDRKLWASARTLADLGELTAQWLEGRIASVPGYCGAPDEETLELVPVLAAANRAGFVTYGSQPGGSGRGWEQRAAVEGFATPATWVQLWEITEGLPLIRSGERATRAFMGWSKALPVSRENVRVCTRFGTVLSRRHLSDSWTGYGECGPEAIRAICDAWQITLIDTEWGRENSPLWPALAEFAALVRSSRPGQWAGYAAADWIRCAGAGPGLFAAGRNR
jgi:hypothetical protein